MITHIAPFLFPLALGVILLLLRWMRRRYKPGHRRRVRAAQRALQRLQAIGTDAQRMAYLRKIDPFTFEELVLEALERRGHRIKRNARYTGDGGIDGQCWIKGRHVLVQSKRYRNHINPAHVRAFQRILTERDCHGLFVHTGRTGKASRSLAQDDPRLTIISGRNLVRLIMPKPSNNHATKRVVENRPSVQQTVI